MFFLEKEKGILSLCLYNNYFVLCGCTFETYRTFGTFWRRKNFSISYRKDDCLYGLFIKHLEFAIKTSKHMHF